MLESKAVVHKKIVPAGWNIKQSRKIQLSVICYGSFALYAAVKDGLEPALLFVTD